MPRLPLVALAACVLAPWTPAAAASTPVPAVATAQRTACVSVDPQGAPGNGPSTRPALSADGGLVVFTSEARNLVAGDLNQHADVFAHDLRMGTVERVSVATGGAEGDGPSIHPDVSADGRFVVFASRATNLVAGDVNGVQDVFVHDRAAGTTARVSVSSAGVAANADCHAPAISADGRWVVYSSAADNLVTGDANGFHDVFAHDRVTGRTRRVSVGLGGAEGDSQSWEPRVSGDGRFVAFTSYAGNLVAGDRNGHADVFVRDRVAGTTVRVSLTASGGEAAGASLLPDLSDDGRIVAFESLAALDPADANGRRDVYVVDLRLGTLALASRGLGGAAALGESRMPCVSGDGAVVAFASGAADLVHCDTNGQDDVFAWERAGGAVHRASLGDDGREGERESFAPAVSRDGRLVAFASEAANLFPGDDNDEADVFVHLRGEFPLYYTVGGLRAGFFADFSVCGAAAGAEVWLLYSTAGGGPVPTPTGIMRMTPPVSLIARVQADAQGNGAAFLRVPSNAAGRTIWTQAHEVGGAWSNGLVIEIP